MDRYRVARPAVPGRPDGSGPQPRTPPALRSRNGWKPSSSSPRNEQEWQDGKQILQSRIDAVNGEIAALTERLLEARRTAAEANGKRAGEVA